MMGLSGMVLIFFIETRMVSVPSCTYKPGATATITEAIWDREDLILSPKISRALWPSECFFVPCEAK